MVKDNTKYPSLQTILDRISECDCAHDTSWWRRHYELPRNRGIKSQLMALERSGFLRSYTRNIDDGRGYFRYWQLTDKGKEAAEHGLHRFRTVSELYGLLYAACFHKTSLLNRDDIDTEFMQRGWRRRITSNVL